jgi:mycothiol synthase
MTIASARDRDLSDAFALLYGAEAANFDGRVAHAFRLVASGAIDADDVIVARQGDAVTGAVYGAVLPGSTAVVWPPRSIDVEATIENDLMTAVLAHVSAAKVVQAILSSEEMDRAGSLTRAGFRHVTKVWELRIASPMLPAGPSRLDLIAYPDVDPGEFLRVLVRCHEDSLDCPELNDLRTPDELLAGYRDCAPEIAQWWLARRDGTSVGVLVLGAGELAFIGVTPEQRGFGFGRELVRFACGFSMPLSLIVDARNTPAIQLYSSVGFETVGSREVYLLAPARSAGR